MQFKKCEKHPLRNVTFSKVAHLYYSWKYNVRSNVSLDLSIVTIFSPLESIEVIKKTKEILLTEKEMVILLLYCQALLNVILLDGCFSRFLNCTNDIKHVTHHIKLIASDEVILGKVLK